MAPRTTYGIRYRFTRIAAGTADGVHESWVWHFHGAVPRRRFASESEAAKHLADRLQVPVTALLKSGAKRMTKLSPIAGVSWHSGQVGWVLKSGTGGVFLTPEVAAAKAKMLKPKKPKAKAKPRAKAGASARAWGQG